MSRQKPETRSQQTPRSRNCVTFCSHGQGEESNSQQASISWPSRSRKFYAFCIDSLRLEDCQPMRQHTQSATKEARNTHSGTCEGRHLVHSQSCPYDAALMLFFACSSSRKPEHQGKSMKSNSTLSYFALSYSHFLSALTHSPPHPARKKFRRDAAMSTCPRPPRLRAFERAAWISRYKLISLK